jgi:hypothetical protein
MRLVDINEELNLKKIINFCNTANVDTSMPAATNMSTKDWENKPNTLLNCIFIQKRFSKENRAGFIFLEKNNEYIAGAGFNQLEVDRNICLTSVRTYTRPDFRGKNLHGEYIIPKQIESAIMFKYKTLLWTFDEYNIRLKNYLEKLSMKENKILGSKLSNSQRSWKSLDFSISLYYTKQYCMYKHLDEEYNENFIQSMTQLKSV